MALPMCSASSLVSWMEPEEDCAFRRLPDDVGILPSGGRCCASGGLPVEAVAGRSVHAVRLGLRRTLGLVCVSSGLARPEQQADQTEQQHERDVAHDHLCASVLGPSGVARSAPSNARGAWAAACAAASTATPAVSVCSACFSATSSSCSLTVMTSVAMRPISVKPPARTQ